MHIFGLLTVALTLGLRHGLDWDHIAALIDISAAGTQNDSRKQFLPCFMYALGHGVVVFILGIAAIAFAAVLPSWIDNVMERVVGITLLLLASYLFYVVWRMTNSCGEFKFVLGVFGFVWALRAVSHKVQGNQSRHHLEALSSLSMASAFSIGALHGIGAETGTQVLLLAALGRTGDQNQSLAMLLTFILGLILSNSLIAFVATAGFKPSLGFKPFFLVAGSTAGVFSFFVGILFTMGQANLLPSLATL